MKQTAIEQILVFLERDGAYVSSCTFENVPIPFPVLPQEYLSFAETDIKDPHPRGAVNALSNAKRSLDARIDSVLIAFCLLKTARAKYWNVPKKLNQISQLGVIAPRVLTKLNRNRNLIEHEFHKPNQDSVEDFVDIVTLFHEATRIYLHNVPNDMQIMDDDTEEWVGIGLNYKSEKIVLDRSGTRKKYIIKPEDPLFERTIKAYAKLLRNQYNQ